MKRLGIATALLAVGSMLLFAVDNLSTNESFDTWVIERISDDVIRKLAKDGTICRVIGHVWVSEPHLTLTLEYAPDVIGYRKCGVCGKMQKKRIGSWE